MAAIITVTAANKAIYLARLEAIADGTEMSPEDKVRELAEVLEALFTAVTTTG